MSEEKFTPGPWKHTEALPRLVEARVARRNGRKIPVTVCHLGEGNGWCKERKWNAFLIAAAPEMYEFIRWIRSVQGQCAIMKWRKFLPEILDKADEILHKAEGEE